MWLLLIRRIRSPILVGSAWKILISGGLGTFLLLNMDLDFLFLFVGCGLKG